jgi:hypothetical protein
MGNEGDMERTPLVVITGMTFFVRARALTRNDTACDEVLGYPVHRAGYSDNNLDSLLPEQFYRPWSHPSRKNVRNLVLRQETRKYPRLVARALQVFLPEDDPVFYIVNCVSLAMAEML